VPTRPPGPPLPYPDSLCHGCLHRRYIHGRASTFVMCTALLDKYPRQPVLRCVAFTPEGTATPTG
jgi:hypothetical protein